MTSVVFPSYAAAVPTDEPSIAAAPKRETKSTNAFEVKLCGASVRIPVGADPKTINAVLAAVRKRGGT